jgi:hypothetical protein
VLIDNQGVCAASELGLNASAIDAIDGSRVAYGFVEEYFGHNSVVLRFRPSAEDWQPAGNASWDATSSEFLFDQRLGHCAYR